MQTQEEKRICKDFMYRKCTRESCRFKHDETVCFYFWKNGSCKFNNDCKKSHEHKCINEKENLEDNKNVKKDKYKRVKNTETFDPISKPVDIRIVYDLGNEKLQTSITSRDVLLVPNLFDDFKHGELYDKIVYELGNCNIDQDKLFKLWHGDSHLIADDHLNYKQRCPTFNMVINRITEFFNMDVKATRFNWYKDTSQWKPFHHDAAAVKPNKSKTQNFTVGLSFGCTRDAAFEHAQTKTIISIPQPDSCIYAFSKDTNVIWRHGILQDLPIQESGRISIIAWGWIDNMK